MPSRFCSSSAPGLSLPLKSEPSTIGRRVSPCSKPTIDLLVDLREHQQAARVARARRRDPRPRALLGVAQARGTSRARGPSASGSLLLVTTPTTSDADQSRSCGRAHQLEQRRGGAAGDLEVRSGSRVAPR